MNSADAHARAFGLADYKSLAIEHPVNGRPADEVRRKTDAILGDVVRILIGAEPAL
jgi:hypothetical protein